jgi:autotransporter-associated beta strand protein
MFRYTHNLAVIDFTNPAKPTKNESIDLPGRLFGFGVIQKTGFIAYSESCTPDAAGNISREVQATAVDGKDGYLIANLPVSRGSRLASLGSDLFVSADGVLTPYRLTEGGGFAALAPVTLSSQPDALRPLGGALFASQGLRLSRVSWPSEGPTVETASLGYSANVNHLAIAADGTVVVPSGPYGVVRIFGPKPSLASSLSLSGAALSGTLLIANPNAGISTGAGLVKTGSELTTSANVSLTATNTFTGATTVSSGGTLTLSGSSGGTSTLVPITSNSSDAVATSTTNGTLVLSGSNTLSGVTTVNSGTLILPGTVSGITPVLTTQPVIIGDGAVINTGTVSFSGTPSN